MKANEPRFNWQEIPARRHFAQSSRPSKEFHMWSVKLHLLWNSETQVNGVFVAGAVPHLILQSTEGGLRAHPFTLDGPISSFTPFNTSRVWSGFAYLTTLSKTMRIGNLPVWRVLLFVIDDFREQSTTRPLFRRRKSRSKLRFIIFDTS